MDAYKILVLLMACHLAWAELGWNQDTPFSKDENAPEGVEFVDSSATLGTSIRIPEEMKGGVRIAKMNYNGTKEPSITGFDEGKTNEDLGATAVQDPDGSWHLVINKTQDFEILSQTSYRFFYDIGVSGTPNQHRVALNIIDINDNAPTISMEGTGCKIAENAHGDDSKKCFFKIVDVDTVGDMMKLRYDIKDSNTESNIFQMDTLEVDRKSARAGLSVKAPGLDYEAFSLHILTIIVKDEAGNEGGNSSYFVIQVEDLPDKEPVWKTIFSSVTIDEQKETTIEVLATDGDININAEIWYRIDYPVDMPDKHRELFIIDPPNRGLIQVKKIDRDTLKVDMFEFDVTAYEKEDNTSKVSNTLLVMVNDLNNNSPIISPTALQTEIEEEKAVQLDLAIEIKDPDLGLNGQFSVTLEDASGNNWHKLFMVIPSTGYQNVSVFISVTNATALDYENPNMRKIKLQLVATEAADSSHVDKVDVMIDLIDLNDAFPVFAEPDYTIPVKENIKKGAHVITIKATDDDEEDKDKVIHSLTSGERMLVIDQLSGEITVARDDAFDYEMQSEVIVQVMAEDRANHKTFVQLTITVGDVNDTPPELVMPMDPGSLKENSTVSTEVTVTEIRATDRDGGSVLNFTIDWTKSYATKLGARVRDSTLYEGCIEVLTNYIDDSHKGEANAILKVKEKKLNWVYVDTLVISIVVIDETTLPEFEARKRTSAPLTINIEDVNDQSPKFTNQTLEAKRTVVELSVADQLIGSIVAIDADGPPYNDVTYLPLGEKDTNLDTGLVKIDPILGELRVDKHKGIKLDGKNETLKYTVRATDGTNTEEIEIEIAIIDTNDKTPQVGPLPETITLLENTVSGHSLGSINYTDADVREEYKTARFDVEFRSNPNLKNMISIDSVTGELKVTLTNGAVLDRDPPGQETYIIDIILTDNYGQGNSDGSNVNDTMKITLKLEDVNDNSPNFELGDPCVASVFENTTQDTVISTGVYAKDIDAGENGKVTYVLDTYGWDPPNGDPPANLFEMTMDGEKGRIRVLKDLRGLWGHYNLYIKASDNPSDATNQSTIDHTCKVSVIDINDNAPIFEYPESGKTIRLRMSQTVGRDLLDPYNKTIPLISATDADDGDNALVTFSLEGSSEALEYFDVDNQIMQRNKAKLILKKKLDLSTKIFELTVKAEDNGSPETQAKTVSFTVKLVEDGNPAPEFSDRQETATFRENNPGMGDFHFVKNATDEDNLDKDPNDDDWEDIYYFIIGATSMTPSGPADAAGVFVLNKTNPELRLNAPVDREMTSSFILTILASNEERQPDNPIIDPTNLSQTTITVTIQDENDSPPKFETEVFFGGVSTADKNGKTILTVTATDPDENDPVTYKVLSVNVSDPTLDNIKDRAFELHPTSGVMTLIFDPNDKMVGFFEFKVQASDSSPEGGENHTAQARVKVYVTSAANRVVFKFRNDITAVQNQQKEIAAIFTDVIEYECSIEDISSAVDGDGARLDNQTDVVTHFIDVVKNEAIARSEIETKVSARETWSELQSRFWDLKLVWSDILPGGNGDTDGIEGLLKIVLIVLCVVLATLVVILFAAFFLKTRSLNRRLEALSTTKFGSQDSGLNRVGMAAPNTNKHAVEGSNPVWNEQINTTDYDVMSEDSYDSDLIGVEERPEFETSLPHEGGWSPEGTANAGYQSDGPRRVSLNPLSMAGLGANGDTLLVDMDSPVEDSFGNPEHSNFTFGKPITDL